MDKEVENLVDLWNNPLCDRASIRASIQLRIHSNNAPHRCCTDSGFYRNKAYNRHKRKTDPGFRCTNSKAIATFLKVHKDKPAFRPTTHTDFHTFNALWGVEDCIRGKFMPVLSEGQERELGWKDLGETLRNSIDIPFNTPKGMYLLHHAHISVDDPRLIAYYPSLKHLTESIYAGDPNLRAVKVKLGKYLTAYRDMLNLSEVDVKEIVERYNGHLASKVGWKVEFIEHDDPDGWFKVYATKGEFTSCMTGKEAVRLYAHDKSELRLAYIESGDGKAVARCIVRDKEATNATGYVRLYGESEDARVFLRSWLADNGYPNQTSLDGCLLPLVEASGGDGEYVCPYIDSGNSNAQRADRTTIEGKQYLMIGEDGDYKCENTDGTCVSYEDEDEDDDSSECNDCGDRTHNDDMGFIDSNQRYVCPRCMDNNYLRAYNGRYEENVPNSWSTWEYDGNNYTSEGLDAFGLVVCNHDGEVHPSDEMVEVYVQGCVWLVFSDYVVNVGNEHRAIGDCMYQVFMDDVATLSDGSTCHKDDVDHYEGEILDEERPRMFVIPATATAVQLYAHN